ncbi:zinc ABC transporter ATP-binding protein AztA [Streptomyces sp. CAU 1734]|uniref:zinc ABC transporter ATP-binding protein AztA n=1 Tax=Streptomyces sp. CAU 1734 TaxID=3140360 RepID=UPI0032604EBA
MTGADGGARVTLEEVSAGYPGRRVLRQLTARIPALASTAIVGANGSGKSTLLGVVAGVIPLTAGRVGTGPGRRPAFVTQRSAVADTLPLTVRETVAMGRWGHLGLLGRLSAHDREVVDASMERLGIGGLAGRRLGELSGGQRQRALVAQGLAQEADLLLLDEPATALDPAARERIAEVLEEVTAQGITVVQATHDLRAARRADHCLLLWEGRLLREGPPGDVLTDELFQQAWQPH